MEAIPQFDTVLLAKVMLDLLTHIFKSVLNCLKPFGHPVLMVLVFPNNGLSINSTVLVWVTI